MQIKIKDYDLLAGQERLRKEYSRELGLGSDSGETEFVRSIITSPTRAISSLQAAVCRALQYLPVGEGGLATTVGPSAFDLTLDLPLVKACLMLAAHSKAKPIAHTPFRGNAGYGSAGYVADFKNTKHDAGPVLDALYQKHGGTWDLKAFEALVWNALVTAYGEETCDSAHALNNFFPGSHIGRYASILAASTLYDFFGAFDPSFTHLDALVGEWWLIQPVSPRLDHYKLAGNLGFHMAGYMPAASLDTPARVVMACYRNRHNWGPHDFASSINSNKFCAGYQRVVWSRNAVPLNQPSFAFVEDLTGVTPESYGPYKHSSELPRWGSNDAE
jgi:hypothetical protein